MEAQASLWSFKPPEKCDVQTRARSLLGPPQLVPPFAGGLSLRGPNDSLKAETERHSVEAAFARAHKRQNSVAKAP
eukprot:5402549-Amphidinium_carterae.1